MNKTVLCTALLSLMNTPIFADNPPQNSQAPAAVVSPTIPEAATTAAENPSPAPQNNALPQDKLPAAPALTPAPVAIDCHYHIPSQTTNIEQGTVKIWAQNAVLQSFDLVFAKMDAQLEELKSCYTEQGWQSFSDALIKSGNVDAIKTQQLSVNSQIDGDISITDSKENQWRVSMPLQVMYQNAQEKVMQRLTVDILVGRKTSGDLGIMQMIATPRNATPPAGSSPANATAQPLATPETPAQALQPTQ